MRSWGQFTKYIKIILCILSWQRVVREPPPCDVTISPRRTLKIILRYFESYVHDFLLLCDVHRCRIERPVLGRKRCVTWLDVITKRAAERSAYTAGRSRSNCDVASRESGQFAPPTVSYKTIKYPVLTFGKSSVTSALYWTSNPSYWFVIDTFDMTEKFHRSVYVPDFPLWCH